MKSQNITFKIDSLEWEGGVTDKFSNTPLGILSSPLKIEQIADVEWTIVYDNFISIIPIDPYIQIKFWMTIPPKCRNKIKKLIEDFFPVEASKIYDRFLIAYSVEGLNEKYIGFTFESMLTDSKVTMYVYMQSRIYDEKSAKDFLEEYLDEVEQVDEIEIMKQEERSKNIIAKVKGFFGF